MTDQPTLEHPVGADRNPLESRGEAVTVRQAAEKLGVSQSLVYALCHDGVLPHTRFGSPGKRGTIRIEDAAVEAYRQTCKGAGKPKAAPPRLKHITLT